MEGLVRKAHKDHICDNHWGKRGNRKRHPCCLITIEKGSQYYDTLWSNERAGGFGSDRWCLPCAVHEGKIKENSNAG